MTPVAVLSATDSLQAAKMLRDIAGSSWMRPKGVIAEVRLDYFAVADLSFLDDAPVPVIVSCRRPRDGGRFRGTEADRIVLLKDAAKRGATYIDIESDCLAALGGVGEAKCIVSHHDFEIVPVDLDGLVAKLRGPTVAMVKVAARLRTLTDIVAVAMTLRRHKGHVTFVGTGPTGLVSRTLADRLGSAWTYGAWVDPQSPIDTTLVASGVPPLPDLLSLHQPGNDVGIAAAFAVVGSSAHESIGPWAWNRFFRKLQIPASYVSLTAPSLVGLREAAAILGIRGISITSPFKLAAIDAADELTPRVKLIGATNTLVNENGKWAAHNTDVEGFAVPIREALKAQGRDVREVRALVVGAGGAGRAALFACKSLGLNVTLSVRDGWKAAPVAELFSVPLVAARAVPARTFDLVVNATPAGSSRDPNGSAVDLAWLTPESLVVESNYRPRETRLVKEAMAAGHRVIRGESIFEAQGFAQAHLFWGGLAPTSNLEFAESVQWAMSRCT